MTAGANDLITIDQAYAWLGITPGSDDVNMQLAVSAYSQLIATWCSRNFVSEAYSEVYDGNDASRLTVRNWPITAVSSLVINDQPVVAAPNTTTTGYRFSDRAIVLNCGARFWRGLQNVTIGYTAGFTTIPADLQIACLEWMKSVYLARDRDTTLTQRRAGDTEEKYAQPLTLIPGDAAAMPSNVYAVLSQYKNVVPA